MKLMRSCTYLVIHAAIYATLLYKFVCHLNLIHVFLKYNLVTIQSSSVALRICVGSVSQLLISKSTVSLVIFFLSTLMQ